VLVIARARLVETVHSLTDVVGGGTTGLVVTLGAASAITTWSRRALLPAGSAPGVVRRLIEVDDVPAPGAGQSRS
jgi:membrane-associated phospholipid phosphatase